MFLFSANFNYSGEENSTADTEYRPQFDLCAKDEDKKTACGAISGASRALPHFTMALKVALAKRVTAAELASLRLPQPLIRQTRAVCYNPFASQSGKYDRPGHRGVEHLLSRAEVAELADAHGSGPCTRKGVGVRVPSSAPTEFYPSCIE